MKKIIICLIMIFSTISINHCQSPDVVLALQPIQEILKQMLRQDAMDFDTYSEMEKHQKKLKNVYDNIEKIKGVVSYIEVVKLIEQYACRLRSLDELIRNPNFQIPFLQGESAQSCLFNFKYKRVLSSFSMANDMLDMVLSSFKMTPSERMDMLNQSVAVLDETYQQTEELENSIIVYNLS